MSYDGTAGDAGVMRAESVVPPRRVFVYDPAHPFRLGQGWRSGRLTSRVLQGGHVVQCVVDYPGGGASAIVPPTWIHDAPPKDLSSRAPIDAPAATATIIPFPADRR